jgi:hypothetical protein
MKEDRRNKDEDNKKMDKTKKKMEVGRDLKEAEEEETFYIFTCLFRDVSI